MHSCQPARDSRELLKSIKLCVCTIQCSHGDQEDLVAAEGSPADDAAAASTTAAELTYTAVQDIIANTLNSKKCAPKLQSDKNIFTVFIILIFSFLFLYIQKAIYFMK